MGNPFSKKLRGERRFFFAANKKLGKYSSNRTVNIDRQHSDVGFGCLDVEGDFSKQRD